MLKWVPMKINGQSLMMNTPQRWWLSFPFVLGFATLAFLAWSASLLLAYPDDGIRGLNVSGLISSLDPNGPTYNWVQVGDIVISVDGVPMSEAFPLYVNKRAGDEVQFIIKRSEQELSVRFTLVHTPKDEIVSRLAILLVALIFCSVAIGVQAFAPSSETTRLFFLFCQVSGMVLASGLISILGPPWVSSLFNFLLWLIGPLTVHFHMHFPQTTAIRWQRLWLAILYVLAGVGGFPYLIWGVQVIRSSPWYAQLITIGRLLLALNLLLVVVLLFYAYRHATSPGARGKIRIVVLGGALSALPIITLFILPDSLLNQPILPPNVVLLVLGIIPLTYGYAIFRHRLIQIEKHVNRGATYILVYSILGGFYLLLYAALHTWAPISLSVEPLVNTLLVLVLASVFVPLKQRVQRIVDTALYGGWYDYRSAVTQITQSVEQITELRELAGVIAERLVKTLRLEDTCVFFRDLEGAFSVTEVAPREKLKGLPPISFSVLPMSSLTFLLKMGGEVGRSSLRKALAEVTLTPEEHQLLNSEQDHLWVPVIGQQEIQGLLALGPKFGGDIFSGEDMDILRLVARQIGPVLENIHLLTRLRQHAAELEAGVIERTAELHDAKERVEAILASVGDGVIVTGLDGSILTVNAAYEEQSGFTASELSGRKFNALFTEQNDAAIMEEMHSTLARGEAWAGELVNRRKGGSQYEIQLTIAPVRDQSGRIVSYVGSQRDVTRQKELDRLKDRFVADVSHELRTPTSNISLYLELMEYAPPEKSAEYLRVIKEQNELLRKLVEDILDLSRLGVGKTRKMEFAAVDLNTIAEEVIIAHRPLAQSSGLGLVLLPAENLPPVRGERNQLSRVITNLVANAIRYTLEGKVTVSTYTLDHQVCLEITDTGIGIELEDQNHLFERFYRGRQVRQSKIHGTGLGLAIVKEIMDLHEGCIDLQSEFGKGSTFRIFLPIQPGDLWLEKSF